MKTYLPKRSNIHLPPDLPIQNKIIEPAKLANVAVRMMSQILSPPNAAKNPENGTTTSDGIGIAALSRADKRKIPA
ncbi:MAG: hypothetical protein HYT61_03980 [Candidatus Yanofskybacteria bacterium]|nr:hypothetical protein [Candidatus Yanofskybacteria bacterium]